MRGFNIGDILETQDHKHKGKVVKIDTVKENGIYDFKITINDNAENEYSLYTDSIHNFIIF